MNITFIFNLQTSVVYKHTTNIWATIGFILTNVSDDHSNFIIIIAVLHVKYVYIWHFTEDKCHYQMITKSKGTTIRNDAEFFFDPAYQYFGKIFLKFNI